MLAKRMAKAGEQLEGEAVDDPVVVAKLQFRLGVSLLNLGFASEAEVLARKAADTFKAKQGSDHPDTLTSVNNLAAVLRAAGRLDEALPLYEEAAQGMEKHRFRHTYVGTIMPNAAAAYELVKQFDKAEG